MKTKKQLLEAFYKSLTQLLQSNFIFEDKSFDDEALDEIAEWHAEYSKLISEASEIMDEDLTPYTLDALSFKLTSRSTLKLIIKQQMMLMDKLIQELD